MPCLIAVALKPLLVPVACCLKRRPFTFISGHVGWLRGRQSLSRFGNERGFGRNGSRPSRRCYAGDNAGRGPCQSPRWRPSHGRRFGCQGPTGHRRRHRSRHAGSVAGLLLPTVAVRLARLALAEITVVTGRPQVP